MYFDTFLYQKKKILNKNEMHILHVKKYFKIFFTFNQLKYIFFSKDNNNNLPNN